MRLLYFSFIILLNIVAIILFWSDLSSRTKTTNIRFKRNRYSRIKDYVKEQIYNNDLDEIFKSSGLSLTSGLYNFIRYTFCLLWVFVIIYLFFFSRQNLSIFHLVFGLVLFIITIPKNKIFGLKTPFSFTIDLFTNNYKKKKNIEVFRAISQIKNVSMSTETDNLGADYILNEILKFTEITRPIFSRMLSIWYMGKTDEACSYFAKAIGTREGEILANIFLKLENLHPRELRDQLDVYQSNVKAERQTIKEKKNEANGNLLYMLAIISAFIVLLNFLVIVLFIDISSSFKFLF